MVTVYGPGERKTVMWACPAQVNETEPLPWEVTATCTYRGERFVRMVRGSIETDWVAAWEVGL